MTHTNLLRRTLLCMLFALAVQGIWSQTSGSQSVVCATRRLAGIVQASGIRPTSDTLYVVSGFASQTPIRLRWDADGRIVHAGFYLFTAEQREAFGVDLLEYVERALLEVAQQTSESEAKRVLSAYQAAVLDNSAAGREVSAPRAATLQAIGKIQAAAECNFSCSMDDVNLICRWTSTAGAPLFAFRSVISRESVEGTDKEEADEAVLRRLRRIRSAAHPIRVPEVGELTHTDRTNMLMLSGEKYKIADINASTYYLLKSATEVEAFFRPDYPVESLHNLALNAAPQVKYRVNIKHLTYGGRSTQTEMDLADFVAYWMAQPDMQVFAGVGELKSGDYEVAIYAAHTLLAYHHILKITFRAADFQNPAATLSATLLTNLPTHNIQE